MSFTIHLGDCIEGMKALADKSVDHVICDPPYEAEAHTLQRRTKQPGWRNVESGDERVVAIDALAFPPITDEERWRAATEMARVCRRWAVVFCQVEASQKWVVALQAAHMSYRRTGVWIKPDGMPQLSGDRPGMGYESIVFCHAKGASKWNGGGKHGVYTFSKNSQVEATGHQTQKPIALMEALVRDFTDPGDLILDPFAGSGTTGVAAIRLGRRFIGFERDAKYHAIAAKRLTATREQLGLFAEGA